MYVECGGVVVGGGNVVYALHSLHQSPHQIQRTLLRQNVSRSAGLPKCRRQVEVKLDEKSNGRCVK